MNNNNTRQPNNNNRRRGRNNSNNNNNRQQQNNRSGFDYNNSIDNRARGNASQMLEKYKKLASDAQFNDDRVNAEYHLQFADHYFRVLADFRSRQEARQEQQGERRPREDTREDNREDTRDDWQNEDRSSSYEEQGSNEGADIEIADDNGSNTDSEDRRPQRDNRPRRDNRPERSATDRPERSNNDRNASRGPRRHHSEEPTDEPAGLDLSVLPPSIAIANDVVEADAKPARKPRARRPKSANDEDMVTAAE